MFPSLKKTIFPALSIFPLPVVLGAELQAIPVHLGMSVAVLCSSHV